MTVVSNDPIWWHAINNGRTCSYFIVAASVGVIYDSALTFAQEVELFCESSDISDDRYRVSDILDLPLVVQSNDCHSCYIMYFAQSWIYVVIPAMLGVITIAPATCYVSAV
ncbi:hypothetical protein BDR07DRAFT_1466720 [Suillus spraguei]|nr:hypothetical protein BDR07DRAFT_1466720 [Suillus spraguei]